MWTARWSPENRADHEGYVAGYFIEAAINHHTLTGGRDRRLPGSEAAVDYAPGAATAQTAAASDGAPGRRRHDGPQSIVWLKA